MRALNYCVFDLEVTAQNSFGRFCNPLDLRNTITSVGFVEHPWYDKPMTFYKASGLERRYVAKRLMETLPELLVGQNIKFDLLYLWEYIRDKDFTLWDTMTVEYLLCGQQGVAHKSLGLDALSLKYGGTLKDSYIKDKLEAGIPVNEIDPEKLLDYNKHDVLNTQLVFKAQYAIAKERQMLPLIYTYMQHLLAVVEMEYNGLHVNVKAAKEESKVLGGQLAYQEQQLETYVENVSSPTQWSRFFFGGSYDAVVDEPTGEFYKTGKRAGQPKTKKVKHPMAIAGAYRGPINEDWRGKAAGTYSVNDDVLHALKDKQSDLVHIIDDLLEWRRINKLLTTYYLVEQETKKGIVRKGVLSKVMPLSGTLHSSFNTTVTETGRLSSTSPNVQNLPPSVLYMFDSRFGKDGCIIEFDFNQLEICIQAWLAQCPQMIKDIESGMDFHRLRLSYALKTTYEDVVNVDNYEYKRKTIAKPISFQKAYGAHYTSVANKTGIPETTVRQVFDEEDKRYPEIREYYQRVVDGLKLTRRATRELVSIRDSHSNRMVTRPGEFGAYGFTQTSTGKRYVFRERASLRQNGDVFRYWQMPEIQNYAVQGTAADLVALAVGEVYLFLKEHRDKALLINEIHDALLIDCRTEYKDLIIQKVSAILNCVSELFSDRFDVDFNVPLRADCKVGKNWELCKNG